MAKRPSANTTRTQSDLKNRIAESQVVHDVLWADEPVVHAKRFQDLSCVLMGVKGIGKTPFLANIPGIYIIATEPGTNWQKVRASEVTTVATFKHFVKEIAPKKVDEVEMWGIDTLDNLETMFCLGIMNDLGITSMSDEGFAGAWFELQYQLDWWIKKLFSLGKGIIMTCHERDRDFEDRNVTRTRASLDLVKRSYKAVTDFADLGMRMKCPAGVGKKRCIVTYPSVDEDCWNRTGVVPERIDFTTEAEAVEKILACFDGGDSAEDTSKPKWQKQKPKSGAKTEKKRRWPGAK